LVKGSYGKKSCGKFSARGKRGSTLLAKKKEVDGRVKKGGPCYGERRASKQRPPPGGGKRSRGRKEGRLGREPTRDPNTGAFLGRGGEKGGVL